MTEAIRTIHLDQPLPSAIPARMPLNLGLYNRYRMPSGSVVSLRKLAGEQNPVVTLRYVNERDELDSAEFEMRLSVFIKAAKEISR